MKVTFPSHITVIITAAVGIFAVHAGLESYLRFQEDPSVLAWLWLAVSFVEVYIFAAMLNLLIEGQSGA